MSSAADRLSAALAERYRIEREIGAGGMATVYLAQDRRHDRPVALKVLNQEKSASLSAERFEREIKLLARLRHPFVLPLHDSGEAGGELYFVMPFIDGESLGARLRREGHLSVEDTVTIVRQVADALDYAHAEGVVHRDIKPENILLSRHGHALLADFGIARGALLVPDRDVALTQMGTAIGTAAYMSPEQALGEDAVDGRSDIYSLGCVVYEMLAGRPPFVGATAFSLIAQHVGAQAQSLTSIRSDLADSVASAVGRALEKDPQARFPTAAAFVEALLATDTRSRITPSTLASAPRFSIAVLPIANRSPDSETEFFSDGMTEELINALAKVEGLRVVSRTSTFAFKGGNVPVGEIGSRLNVGFVLEASVRRALNRLRVTARLVEVVDDSTVWSETYERQLEDVFAVQDEITHAIVETITATLELGRLQKPASIAHPQSLAAYDLYLLGRHHWYKRTQAEMQRALELFQQAAEADPSYAPAYSGIADASALLASWQFASPQTMYPKAVAAARRAIELDPSSADAHASLGFINLNWEWDWDGATRELRRAIEINPNHETAHRWLSAFFAGIGKDEEAVPIAQRAIDLDPISVLPRMNLGIVHLLAGRHAEAAAEFRRVVETDPEFVRGYLFLGAALSFLDRHDEAIAIGRFGVEKAKQLPVAFVPLGTSLARAGRLEEAHAILDPIVRNGIDPFYAAMALSVFGDESAVLSELERGFEKRSDWMSSIGTQPWFRAYRGSQRFVDLLQRMKLLPAPSQP
jgi:serine/threonine protein kinase/tetratricopeptide (TPR) repeat protein